MQKMLMSIVLLEADRHPRAVTAIWATFAALSITVAAYLASRPGQLADLTLVRHWLQYWLTTHDNPYLHFGPTLDYPPIAFLLLWPVALVPAASLVYWFLPVAITLTVAVAGIQLRWLRQRLSWSLSPSQQFVFIALVVSGGGFRSAVWRGQTVAAGVLLCILALYWSRQRPILAACCLALGSFKLHIAAGVGLAILFTVGPLVPILATVIIVAASALFAATIGQSVFATLSNYAGNLWISYGGSERIRGFLSIRFVLDDFMGNFALSTGLYVALALGTLASLALLSRRRTRDPLTQVLIAASCMLWTLIFLPHQIYNGLLASLPVFLLLRPESGLLPGRTLRAFVGGGFVLFGLIDIPRVMRLLGDPEASMFWISYYLSPLRLAGLFALILWRLYQRPRIAIVPAINAQ